MCAQGFVQTQWSIMFVKRTDIIDCAEVSWADIKCNALGLVWWEGYEEFTGTWEITKFIGSQFGMTVMKYLE